MIALMTLASVFANGAGKSTLLKVVSALVKSAGGKIVFCEEELLGSDEVRKAYLGG